MTSEHAWDPHSQDFAYAENQAQQYSVSARGTGLKDFTVEVEILLGKAP
jgi:hypothetical protein